MKLDTSGENFKEGEYYPTNAQTTFTSGDESFEFPVPGVKGTIPSYQVKYEYKGDVPTGALAKLPADETHKMHTDVTVAAEPKLDGYVFSGWTTGDAPVSGGQFKMPGKNVTLTGSWTLRSDLSYTVNYYWNGTEEPVAPSKTVDGQTFGARITDEVPISVDGYTALKNQTCDLTIGTGTNVINFYYYKNVTLTANSDTAVYDGKEHSVSGFTGAPDGADFSAIEVVAKGTNVGTYPAQFQEGTVGTVDATEKYIVAEAKDGLLTIMPIGGIVVTITGNTKTVTYDGDEHTATGYTFTTKNPLYTEKDFTFTGDATAKGTDAGTYMMGLTPAQFENTNPNFENVTFSVTDGALTITRMPLTITAGSDSKAYDGTPLTCGKFDSTTPAEGDTVASVTLTGSQTNVGSSDNVASDAKLMRGDRDVTANYAIEYVNGKLTVTKNESAKLTADAYRGVYDGAAHDAVVKTTITGAVEGDSWTYAYSLDGENYTAELPQVKNVGAYPVWVKATNDNYVDLVTVVTAEVTPATVLVTADSHEWIIAVKDTCVGDPEPALTYQAESPVAGETPAFSGELSREPGAERGKTYQILQDDLALADGENFLASNYVLQFVPGELTVKARDITITKTVDVTKAFVGDKLTYTITVTNTGDVDLQDVAVVDEMLGIEQVIGELKAGESWTQQFTYTAQESDAGKTLVNTAVTGTKDEKTFDQVDSDGTEITQKPVPTGDQSMVGLWTATLLISAAGAAIILARKSRRSK